MKNKSKSTYVRGARKARARTHRQKTHDWHMYARGAPFDRSTAIFGHEASAQCGSFSSSRMRKTTKVPKPWAEITHTFVLCMTVPFPRRLSGVTLDGESGLAVCGGEDR